MSDDVLVRRALEGDDRALTLLVDRHSPACLRFATRMLGDAADAEDAVQETFVRAYRALDRYEPRETFRAWLFAILVNRCRTAAWRRGKRRRRFVHDEVAMEGAFVDSDAAATDSRVEVSLALDALEPDQREAFLLKHVEGLSYEEMAAATGVGVSALKMRVKRACERLQRLLAEVTRVD
jgi:RNA polymerase sigma-70 factor, ECF subfamily